MDRITKQNYKFNMLNIMQGMTKYTEIDEIMNCLADYENTGLTPEEITDHEAIFKVYRNVCGGKSPDEISALIVERDTLKKALEKYQKTEQWLNDMNNPLEPIKVSAALDSEIMKLNYRKEHNPESISELDGTIISALLFIQQAQEQEEKHEANT